MIGPTVWDPVGLAFVPLHPKDAVQLLAFVVDHDKLTLCPLVMVKGPLPLFARKSTVAAGGGGGGGGVVLIVKVALSAVVPPGPVQFRVYVLLPAVAITPVVVDPPVATDPLHAPLAEQVVALELLQVKVAEEPTFIDVGLTDKLTEGAAGGVPTVTALSTEHAVNKGHEGQALTRPITRRIVDPFAIALPASLPLQFPLA